MTPSKKFLQKIGLKDPEAKAEPNAEKDSIKENSRRGFLKKSAFGGITLGGAFLFTPIEELIAQSTQKVNDSPVPLICRSPICVIASYKTWVVRPSSASIPTRVFMVWVK